MWCVDLERLTHASNRSVPPCICTVAPMELETAIRTRRTHKAFGPDPVDDAVLATLGARVAVQVFSRWSACRSWSRLGERARRRTL